VVWGNEQLMREPGTYRWLDAAQLVKHAFGIAHTFPCQDVGLEVSGLTSR
jgi:hypothetical protein